MGVVGVLIENFEWLYCLDRYNGVITLLYCNPLTGNGKYYATNLFDRNRFAVMATGKKIEGRLFLLINNGHASKTYLSNL